MNIRFLRVSILFSIFLLMAGCASSSFYHRQFMTGQVVQAAEGQTVVCIGEPNGAEAGQILDVYRAALNANIVEEGQSAWVREWVGKVKVDEIIDEHFATVEVLEGDVMKNDIVELK